MAIGNNLIISELNNHIEILISKYESMVTNNSLLKKENDSLKNAVEKSNNKLKDLEKRIEEIQVANAFTASSAGIKEAKQKINKIVKEIDKCISLLND